MTSVFRRKLVLAAVAAVALVSMLSATHGFAETKTTTCTKCVRAVYKDGLDLHEEPTGTILADPSVCLSKNQGAERYDYAGQLKKTVEKANTRMTAQVLDQQIAGYTGSIELLERNIALISGTIANLKQLDGIMGYLLPIGTLQTTSFQGAKFEGKCYRAPDVKTFGQPDALGELNPQFGFASLYAESSPSIEKALKEELPRKLSEFAALEANKALSKKEKEEQFGRLTDEVMKKVGDFMAIDPVKAAELMPREFGGRGTRISSTPSISLTLLGQPCTHVTSVLGIDVDIDGKMYDITVNAVSVSHTFRKCMPEKYALPMLKDQLEAKKKLLQKAREKFAKLLSAAGKELAALQKKNPQYFGD